MKAIRLWLLRKLAMGRPVVLNVSVNGLVDFRGTDSWGVMADSHIDGSNKQVVLKVKPCR